MNVHHILFFMAALVYDVAMPFLPLVLLAGICHWIKEVYQNGWRNSSKQLLMIIGAIALLVMITPESIKVLQSYHHTEDEDPGWAQERDY